MLAQQIRSQHVDMDSLKTVLPDFGLRVAAGRDNILSSFLRTKRIAFSSLDIAGTNCDSLPVSLRMRVEKLAYGSIVLDTLTASAVQNGSRLEYALRVANAPGNLDNIALAGVYGHVVRNTGAVNFYQKNRAGREGFRFGVDAAWNDSLIRASVTPLAPVFGSEPWTVNPGNYLVYRFDGNLSADLDMTHGDQRFAIHPVPETDSLRGIRLDITGLNIGGALAMLPSAPPVGGVLCAIGQILIDKTKLTPARILTVYVVAGLILEAVGLYSPLVKWAGAGATVPLTGFGSTLAKGVEKAVSEVGVLGAFTGGFTAAAAGIGAAVFFGIIIALLFRPKAKS